MKKKRCLACSNSKEWYKQRDLKMGIVKDVDDHNKKYFGITDGYRMFYIDCDYCPICGRNYKEN